MGGVSFPGWKSYLVIWSKGKLTDISYENTGVFTPEEILNLW